MSDPSTPETKMAPPGWYGDPQNPGHTRYWDGATWTDHSQPVQSRAESRALEKEAKAATKAEQQYRASPVGRAEAALKEGAKFFEVTIPHSSVNGYSNLMLGSGDVSKTRIHKGATDILGQIEELGWKLEHASWVFIETGTSSRDKMLSSGQNASISGRVDGIYLFRAVAG